MDELTRRGQPSPALSAQRLRRSSGLSMIEVMIALTILAGGLLVVLTMQIQATRAGRHGRNATEASRIAQNQMEVLNNQDFTTLAVTGGWTPVVAVNGVVTGGPATAVPQAYSLDWMVSANPDPNPSITADTFQVDVRVRWTDPNAPAGTPQRAYVISSIRYDD
ncbi:MAG: hypothetical protein CL910_19615 [Deltaproteobacteria bacterium]|jgi:Tfp pilus assembly protein PilV|nr:hypothetical protein [Deltaproteobacteria bacterium]